MRRRPGVACCLLADPELLILDEPMNGLDPAGILEMRHLIRELVAEGRTVLLSSHLLDEVEKTCDLAAIVDMGKVVAHGTIRELVRGGPRAIDIVCHSPRGRPAARRHARRDAASTSRRVSAGSSSKRCRKLASIRPDSGAAGSAKPPASSGAVRPRGSSRSASGLPCVSARMRSRTRSSSGPASRHRQRESVGVAARPSTTDVL
jgi:ABC-type multidrug transport system ATPase subunit